jgi:hypothetical protein
MTVIFRLCSKISNSSINYHQTSYTYDKLSFSPTSRDCRVGLGWVAAIEAAVDSLEVAAELTILAKQ